MINILAMIYLLNFIITVLAAAYLYAGVFYIFDITKEILLPNFVKRRFT